MAKEKTTVALISTDRLGDTLLQMVIANNLAVNNLAVTFFSDYGVELKNHIIPYSVSPFMNSRESVRNFAAYDVVLYDQSSSYIKQLDYELKQWLDQNAIGFLMSSGHPQKTKLSASILRKQLQNNSTLTADSFLSFNNTIKQPSLSHRRASMVQQIKWFLTNKIKLPIVNTNTGLCIQRSRKIQNDRRIIVHPTSTSSYKNWDAEKFVNLCMQLKQAKFQPVITVSPQERPLWQDLSSGEIEVPLFRNIVELAEFYLTCNWFIGTDSGNAHLASALGIPTFQIFKRWRNYPSWRAGWAENMVITAKFPNNFSKNNWQRGLDVETVYNAFLKWINKIG